MLSDQKGSESNTAQAHTGSSSPKATHTLCNHATGLLDGNPQTMTDDELIIFILAELTLDEATTRS